MEFDKKGFLFLIKLSAILFVLIIAAEFLPAIIYSPVFGENSDVKLPSVQSGNESIKLSDSELVYSDSGGISRQINNNYPFNFLSGKQGKAIVADLTAMELFLYQDGKILKKYKILSKGRPGSSWETPTGEYKVNFKSAKHFSSIGKVWMPWSIQFYGNFFIHGWPYYPSGEPVSQGYSGGCIRLSTEDAREVFEFAENDTSIFVSEKSEPEFYDADIFKVADVPKPDITAKSFLVADIKTGAVFLEKDSLKKRPIASLTKLMTAVAASEAIFFERTIKINESVLKTYGDTGNLQLGEVLSLNDLLYPLLMESSNDAAKAIAEMVYGEKKFVSLMNNKALALSMLDTSYADASGLESGNISTADDLFKLSRYLFEKRKFLLNITKEPSKKLISQDGTNSHTFNNFNEFSGFKEFVGGKTGYTEEAGKTMVAIFSLPIAGLTEKEGTRDIAIIVLNSEDRKEDVKRLLDWTKKVLNRQTVQSNQSSQGGTKLCFTGDIMLDRGVKKAVLDYGKGDFRFPFQKISSYLRGCDALFGNLEGPISDKGENKGSLYSFRMNPLAVYGLEYAGFNVLSVANNHIGDWGIEAMRDTFIRLKEKNILYVGGGFNEAEAYKPKILSVNGIKIAFLAFSQFGKDYLEAKNEESGIAIADEGNLKDGILEAKEKADIVVASFHFGDEYQNEPNIYQKRLSRLAVDLGADFVIGHHPHVVQPIEKYKDSYIAYSLGNFVFDQNFSTETSEGIIFETEINFVEDRFSNETKKNQIVGVNSRKIKINEKFQPVLF